MPGGTGAMSPQDWYNLFAPAMAQMQIAQPQNGQQPQPMPFLGQQQRPPQPQQPQGLSALGQGGGQQGSDAYGQIGGLLAKSVKGLVANFGANGSSNALADAVGFQPFGGGGWGSGE